MCADTVKNKKPGKSPKGRGGIEGILVEGESMLHVSYVHWAVFINSALAILFGILVAVFFSPIVAFVIWVMASYPFCIALIRYTTTRLVLTDKRVFAKYGFFNIDKIQIKLSRIESAHTETPFLGQFLGYGTVMIQGTGQGVIPITYIKDAGDYVKKLENLTLASDTP